MSHAVKINRARKHLEDLRCEVVDWFDHNAHFTYRIEPDPDSPPALLMKVTADEIPVEPFSLIIGDAVQNIRIALDHIAFALAVSNAKKTPAKPLTDEDERDSQFPIIGDVNSKGISGQGSTIFANARGKQIRRVCPVAQADIERVQPYQLGSAFIDHPLWWLRELSNADKHRSLIIGAAFSGGIIYGPRPCTIGGVLTAYPKRPIKNDTEVAKIGTITPLFPDDAVEMCVRPQITIAFDNGPLAGEIVLDKLREILAYVCNEVIAPLENHL